MKCYHFQIDVAGVELHVDLLVDEGLALLGEVLANLGSHSGSLKHKVRAH